jgi:hypothetical protein
VPPPCEVDTGPPVLVGLGSDRSAEANAELIARAPIIAVVEVSFRIDECSGAGGAHVILRPVEIVRGQAIGLVHHGGHAYWPAHEFEPGDLFVAGIWPIQRLDEDRDGNPDSSRAGWCLSGLPRTEALAGPVEPAAGRDAALARARDLADCTN